MSANVRIEGISKTFPGKNASPAIDDLNLDLAEGELLVLLGPSGCGKTTTLRCVAGLEFPEAGRIEIDGRPVFDAAKGLAVPPNKRDIGMVFQSYALWPHKTVRQNIAYPLKSRRMKDKINSWVPEMAEKVECSPLLDRLPSQLSGGQQQRIALARGLVARPGIVLFDEPLSNLDARLRDQVRAELHSLHRNLGFSGLYVTHDQLEALALGDRLAVMRAGHIEHLGTPREVYETPATEYVAGFIGYVNRVLLSRTPQGWTANGLALNGAKPACSVDGDLIVRLRPEDVAVVPDGENTGTMFTITGARVADRVYAGRTVELVLDLAGDRIRVSVPTPDDDLRRFDVGALVSVGFDPASSAVFSGNDGSRVDLSGSRPQEHAAPAQVAP